MRVITWNVNGIRARASEVSALCRRERPDVLCLQEIKATAAQVPEPLTLLPEYTSFWHGGPRGYSGVSLHVRRDRAAAPAFRAPPLDVEHRAIEAALGPLRVLSVYVPNGNRDLPGKIAFLEAMAGYARDAREAGDSLLVCGDLNVARTEADVHPRMRNPNAVGQLPRERALLEAILAEGLEDLGRAFDPENQGLFTWWPPWREERQKNRGWRLDYVLASAPLARRATGCRVLGDFGTSDHAPVLAELDVELPGGA
ncbi:MAG TPA: exodeoxyribonuclease III [Kofleriaceae bacterium]|nr:exodeoxyribonuclease III [Kofleriaceae bacterium]